MNLDEMKETLNETNALIEEAKKTKEAIDNLVDALGRPFITKVEDTLNSLENENMAVPILTCLAKGICLTFLKTAIEAVEDYQQFPKKLGHAVIFGEAMLIVKEIEKELKVIMEDSDE